MKSTPYDYTAVLDSFFATAQDCAPERLNPLKQLTESTARRALDNPDVIYMPAFKVLDLLGHMVNLSIGIAREPHLRTPEAKAMLQQLFLDSAPLLTQFKREAALERARYEPVMLTHQFTTTLEKRNAILEVRLHRMLSIYRDAGTLSTAQLHQVEEAAKRAIISDDFARYRAGPMCQCFAEMLSVAEATPDIDTLKEKLATGARLWKSFRLKSHRYSAEAPHVPTTPTPITYHLH